MRRVPVREGGSAKALPHQHHQFLLALVDLFQVVYELGKLNVAVLCQQESFPCFAQELYEFSVVPRTDVRQSRVRGVYVRRDCGVQELPQRCFVC